MSLPAATLPFTEVIAVDGGVINQIAWSLNGISLALGTSRGVMLYDALSLLRQRTILSGTQVSTLAFTPDGEMLVTGGVDARLQWWDPLTGRYLGELQGHLLGIKGLQFAVFGSHLISISDDTIVRVWDTATVTAEDIESANLLYTLRDASSRLTSLAVNTAGQRLVAGGFQRVWAWDLINGQLLLSYEGFDNWITAMAFSPDGQILVTTDDRDRLLFWNGDTLRPAQVLILEEGSQPLALAFSPNGETLATGHKDGRVMLWDVDTLSLEKILPAHDAEITSLAFSSSGIWLASGSEDGVLRVWRVIQPEEEQLPDNNS